MLPSTIQGVSLARRTSEDANVKIFWSWQSDTHQPSGRHFVRDVLVDLATHLNGVEEAEEAERPDRDEEDDDQNDRVGIDHDTLGVGGSPRIADTILRKIDKAAVFVADVTPVGKTPGGKYLPNPNVMIELGYALRVMELERIVLVMNRAEGAVLKNLPFDLRHWRAPVTYALPRDATDERRVEVANQLKDDLRHVIEPGLKAAAKVFREEKRRMQRAPDLAVTLPDEEKVPFRISQTVNDQELNVPSVQEIQGRTPLLTVPRPSPILGGPVLAAQVDTRSLFRPKPVEQWTREEKEGYNRGVERYYREYRSYLQTVVDHIRLAKRSIKVNLDLQNTGTLPATGIEVEITFPEGIILHNDRGGFPDQPSAPDTPELVPPGVAVAQQIPHDFSGLEPYAPPSSWFDPVVRRGHFKFDELKHHRQLSLPEFTVSFATSNDIRSFEAEYVITANEPVDPIRGTIGFEVELTD